jgi:hypothetical protein
MASSWPAQTARSSTAPAAPGAGQAVSLTVTLSAASGDKTRQETYDEPLCAACLAIERETQADLARFSGLSEQGRFHLCRFSHRFTPSQRARLLLRQFGEPLHE